MHRPVTVASDECQRDEEQQTQEVELRAPWIMTPGHVDRYGRRCQPERLHRGQPTLYTIA
jgi:hypothetical protein